MSALNATVAGIFTTESASLYGLLCTLFTLPRLLSEPIGSAASLLFLAEPATEREFRAPKLP